MRQQTGRYLAYFGFVESVAFPQLRRAVGAVEHEHSFAFRTDDMHMRRQVITRVDRDPRTVEAQNCRHSSV